MDLTTISYYKMPMTVRMASLLTLNCMEIKSVIYALCWTNLCVDTLNSKYTENYAKSYNDVKEVKGHGNTKSILHKKPFNGI